MTSHTGPRFTYQAATRITNLAIFIHGFWRSFMTQNLAIDIGIKTAQMLFKLLEILDCAAAKIAAIINPAMPTGISVTTNKGKYRRVLNPAVIIVDVADSRQTMPSR